MLPPFPQLRLFVTGIKERIAALEGLERDLLAAIAADLAWWGQLVVDEMILTHSFQNITGRLERSIGFTVESWSGNKASVLVFALAPYAQAVESGTPTSRPYPFFWPVIYGRTPVLEARLSATVARILALYADVRTGVHGAARQPASHFL